MTDHRSLTTVPALIPTPDRAAATPDSPATPSTASTPAANTKDSDRSIALTGTTESGTDAVTVINRYGVTSATTPETGRITGPAGTALGRRTGSGSRPDRLGYGVTVGALALLAEDDGVEWAVPPRPVLRLVPTGPELPEVRSWSVRLVQAVTEVLAGDRPVGQLIRWTDPLIYTELSRRVRMLGLTTTATGRSTRERASIRSVHVCHVTEAAAEVSAHLRIGHRSHAAALRLEPHRGRWICTALELG